MADRRIEFEKKFKLVWTTGPTGCSIFHVTTQSMHAGEALIADLLSETLTADVEMQRHADVPQGVKINRHFITHEIDFPTQIDYRAVNFRITGVTSDLRVAELIERIDTHKIGSEKIPFDTIITPMITGSPDYIEWVKLQTMKKDPELAFYNDEPEDEI